MIKKLNFASTEDYFSTEEAAEFLGIKESVLRNYLWQGKFTTYKFKKLTLLEIDELKTWKEYRSA